MLIYEICSTDDTKQYITRQTRELKALGVTTNNLYLEYASGNTVDTGEFNKLLNKVDHGYNCNTS